MSGLKDTIRDAAEDARKGNIEAGIGLLLFTLTLPITFPLWLIVKALGITLGHFYGILFPIPDEVRR